MKNFFAVSLCLLASLGNAQTLDVAIPIRGLAIAAPLPDQLGSFLDFIDQELGPGGINTLVLRVDYNYQYQSHPELRNEIALSESEVKQLVAIAKKWDIRLIPQINLLGHQSWAEKPEKLLQVYPQFDETPHVKFPEKYEWPNKDGLYCKSYCPLHPDVHGVVFELVAEILEVFEADAFHAGMDEVFYLADDQCPRCAGKNKARLFADEVIRIRDFLATKDATLWIWGDRLLDGENTGLGMWEASQNDTWEAIKWIPNDVVICDWHYERAEPTAPYFAQHGLQVVSCPWRISAVGQQQVEQLLLYREHANDELKEKFQGVLHTVWSPVGPFLQRYYNDPDGEDSGDVQTLKALIEKYKSLK